MASVNQTLPHCVNQMGKTHPKPLAARHGKGTAWARHAMCESAFRVGGLWVGVHRPSRVRSDPCESSCFLVLCIQPISKEIYSDGCFAHSYVELWVVLEDTKGVGATSKHAEIGIRNTVIPRLTSDPANECFG